MQLTHAFSPELISDGDEGKLSRSIEHKVLSKSAEVNSRQGRPEEEASHEVPVSNSLHRVAGNRLEAQVPRQGFPVDGKRVASHGSASKGTDVCATEDGVQVQAVLAKGTGVTQQPVRPENRLRALKVRVPGHHDVWLPVSVAMGSQGVSVEWQRLTPQLDVRCC